MTVLYWQDSARRRDTPWAGRGLAWEIGPRAYRYLLLEGRRDGHGAFFPPALEEAEASLESW